MANNLNNHQLFYQNKLSKNWLAQDRINFLINEFPLLSRNKTNFPLGQYFKAAGLLNDYQIGKILEEQKYSNLYFGEIAILKGYLDSNIVDFFLELALLRKCDHG